MLLSTHQLGNNVTNLRGHQETWEFKVWHKLRDSEPFWVSFLSSGIQVILRWDNSLDLDPLLGWELSGLFHSVCYWPLLTRQNMQATKCSDWNNDRWNGQSLLSWGSGLCVGSGASPSSCPLGSCLAPRKNQVTWTDWRVVYVDDFIWWWKWLLAGWELERG